MEEIQHQNWTSRIWLWSDRGIPLTYNPLKPKPHYWSLPGGKGDPGDKSPWETIIRETREETGIRIEKKNLIPICIKKLRNHLDPSKSYFVYLFAAKVNRKEILRLKPRSRHGDVNRLFSFAEMDQFISSDENPIVETFHPRYKELAIRHGLWPHTTCGLTYRPKIWSNPKTSFALT